MPLFDAGKTKARSIEADAELKTRLAEAEDLRARIYYEVQGATLDLAAASDQVSVAREAVNVAEQALAQAEDRFRAGVTNNLEVVEAQQALSGTRENFIGSLYSHNVAKAALARALGMGEQEFLQILEGKTSWPTKSLTAAPGGLRGRARWLVVGGLILVAIVVAAWVHLSGRETTDDAQIDGHIAPIAAKVGGTYPARPACETTRR